MTETETRKAVSIKEVRRHLEPLKSEHPAEVVEGELSEVEADEDLDGEPAQWSQSSPC